jgi:hypothetical protein
MYVVTAKVQVCARSIQAVVEQKLGDVVDDFHGEDRLRWRAVSAGICESSAHIEDAVLTSLDSTVDRRDLFALDSLAAFDTVNLLALSFVMAEVRRSEGIPFLQVLPVVVGDPSLFRPRLM